jgi:hypothetical protein
MSQAGLEPTTPVFKHSVHRVATVVGTDAHSSLLIVSCLQLFTFSFRKSFSKYFYSSSIFWIIFYNFLSLFGLFWSHVKTIQVFYFGVCYNVI